MLKRCAALLLVAFSCFADLAPTTLADITGDGAAHKFATSGRAKWVQIIALSSNGSAVRIGDSNAGVSRGMPVAAGGGLLLPVQTNNQMYDLSAWYYYVANGDKVSITWAN